MSDSAVLALRPMKNGRVALTSLVRTVALLSAVSCGGDGDGEVVSPVSGGPSVGGPAAGPAAGGPLPSMTTVAPPPGVGGETTQSPPVGGSPVVAGPGATGVAPSPSVPGTAPVGSPITGPDGQVTPEGVASETPGEPIDTVNEALLDDFEDGDSSIEQVAGRAGYWGTYNDGTGTQTPAPGSPLKPEAGGANSTGYAIHTSGSGFSDWGAGLQVDLNNSGSRSPYDASAYGGITFFARGSGNVRIELVTTAISVPADGGNCAEDCYDSHGANITLGDAWQQHTVVFGDVAQEGWGAPAAFDPSQILGINFKMTKPDEDTPVDFDLWLDELKFADPGTDSSIPPPEQEPEPVIVDPTTEPGMCSMDLGRYDGNGSVTYYTFAMGSTEVNCSYQITGNNPDTVATINTGQGRYFGAMNTQDYSNSAMCGACVEVTRDGGRSVVITIVDQCPIATNPKCTAGHIDLSHEAFRQLGEDSEGHLGTGNGGAVGNISWHYVECPVDGQNVTFRLKEPQRMDWNELLVQGHRWPITSVQIDGQNATRKAYNYWEPPTDMGAGPWHVRVTDAVGGVVDTSITRDDMDAGVQFTCQ